MKRQTKIFRRCMIQAQACRAASGAVKPPRPAAEPAPARLRPFTEIPGPLAMPMLRHGDLILPRIGSFHHSVGLGMLESLRERYGDLVRLPKATRKRPALYIFDPNVMLDVYETKGIQPVRWEGSPLLEFKKKAASKCPAHGQDITPLWAGIESILNKKDLVECFHEPFTQIADDLTRRLGELSAAGDRATLNAALETEARRWALEVLGMVVFGTRLGCLAGPAVPEPAEDTDDDEEEVKPPYCTDGSEPPVAEWLVQCSADIADGRYLVRHKATLKKDSETFKDALEVLDVHFSIMNIYLKEAREKYESGGSPEQIFFEKLLPLNEKALPLVADMFLAGVEPVANTALSMLYKLSLHPAVQQRALDEAHWAAETEADAGARPPRMYAAAAAREALRLYPATGGVVRRTVEPVGVGGYEVPAGVDIVLAHGATSKLQQHWARGEAFIPERWSKDCIDPLRASRAHPLTSVPFGQYCPASKIVYKMLSTLVSQILGKHRLEWHGPPPTQVNTGVNRLEPPYYFVLEKAA